MRSTSTIALAAGLLGLAAAGVDDIGSGIGPKDYKFATAPPAAPFRFSSAYSDDMVLQQAPEQAVVWGFAPAGAKVAVSFNGAAVEAPVSQYMGASTFMAKLPATKSSMTMTHNITATSGGKQG